MRPFVFRVLAVAATGVLVSACIFGGNGKDGTPSGGDSDSGTTAHADGGNGGSSMTDSDSGGGSTDAGGSTKDASNEPCPRPVALSNIPTWRPSVQKLGACTSNEIGLLSSYLTEPPSSWASAQSMLSAGCQKCVFSNVGDTNWGVVVWSPNQSAGTGFIDVGGCFQLLASTGGNSCGAAAQQVSACEDMACPATCSNLSSCRSTVQTGACGSSLGSAQSACGSNYTNFASTCSSLSPGSLVNVVCGAGGAG